MKAFTLIVIGISVGLFYLAASKEAEYAAKKISRELSWRKS